MNAQRARIADAVTRIIQGNSTGAMIYGPGGRGKSYEVITALDNAQESYELYNSHATPTGLFDFLAANRQSVCVFEDCESLIKNVRSLGILRSATHGSARDRAGNKIRKITYFGYGKQRECIFTGAIIMTMNRPLSNWPEAQALASRIECIEYNPTDSEVASLMRDIAKHGEPRLGLSEQECCMIVEYVIREAKRARRLLHLRMIEQAYVAFATDDAGDSHLTWKDTVASNICEYDSIVEPIQSVGTRAAQKELEIALAAELEELPPNERFKVWQEKTGKSQASMYRRMKDLAVKN